MKYTSKHLINQICANWYYVTYGEEIMKKLDLLAYKNLVKELNEFVVNDDLYKTMVKPYIKKDEYDDVIELELLMDKLTPNIFKILDLRKKTADINKDFEK